jgi:hypothetical protein
MQIDKSQIIEFLKERGHQDEAERAEQNLPDQVDTDEQGGLLAQHGISVRVLTDKLGGDDLSDLI